MTTDMVEGSPAAETRGGNLHYVDNLRVARQAEMEHLLEVALNAIVIAPIVRHPSFARSVL